MSGKVRAPGTSNSMLPHTNTQTVDLLYDDGLQSAIKPPFDVSDLVSFRAEII